MSVLALFHSEILKICNFPFIAFLYFLQNSSLLILSLTLGTIWKSKKVVQYLALVSTVHCLQEAQVKVYSRQFETVTYLNIQLCILQRVCIHKQYNLIITWGTQSIIQFFFFFPGQSWYIRKAGKHCYRLGKRLNGELKVTN